MSLNVKKGFTLIELLIVVSIIGLLSATLLPSIMGAPKKARDATRKSLINSVVAAAESYNLDKGGYPAATFCLDGAGAATEDIENDLINYIAGGVPASAPAVSGSDAVGEVPPCTGPTNTYVYYEGTAGGYTVAIRLESDGAGNMACDADGCGGAGPQDYFGQTR